ncbi:MAG: hypothetical protein JWM07_759 [Candidatus Saccharibacteria bacterium]|jgi:prepilin-type N-terminal cleavage/methylation domain-containing protein|nr:hypothetical protein [Candidatus Saccharibacteria bacterium]
MSQEYKRRSRRGFTIVELIMVIAVLGLLAGIIAVGYGSWRAKVAKDEVRSDLTQAVTAMENARNYSNGYPSAIPSSFSASSNVTVSYITGDLSNYCIEARSTAQPSISYFANTAIGKSDPRPGDCLNGETVPSGQVIAKQVTVSTLAGGLSSCTDGTGSGVGFGYVYGSAVDSIGTVYVADADCMSIRKVTSSGVTTVFAGSLGSSGSTNGTGASARFNFPTYITIDASGVLYVSDKGNHKIRKITPAGVVTTLAGSGVAGFADGTGAAAQFNNPAGIAVDSSGNVYVADTTNARIRKITPAGVVTTLAGNGTVGFADGTGANARFSSVYASDVAVNSSGMLYVADTGNNRIRQITPSGTVTTLAGNGTYGYVDGAGSVAQFRGPQGIAVDSTGGIYVGDSGNNRIRYITPSGTVTTLAGNGTSGYVDGAASSAQFRWVSGIDVDSAGGLIVSDYNNRRIRIIR